MNIELKGLNASEWNYQGRFLRTMGKYKEAIACYDQAIKIEPKHIAARYNKGNVMLALGKYHEAVNCYDKVIKITPKDADAWQSKGWVLDALVDTTKQLYHIIER